MHALITGGAGFIGSHLVDSLLLEGHKVTVLDSLENGILKNVHSHIKNKSFKFFQGDVRNQKFVSRVIKDVDTIFHLAANLQEDGGVEDPLSDFETNVIGTFNILLAAKQFHAKMVIFSSSVMVYGGRDKLSELPINEDDSIKITTPYSASKFTGEKYCLLFNRIYGLKTVVLRYFNVYGSRVRLDNPYLGVVNKFVQNYLKKKPMTIYGDGHQTRDFVDVRDVVNATMLAAVRDSAVGEVINVGSGIATSINKLANIIQSIFLDMGAQKIPPPIHEDPRSNEAYIHAQAGLKKATRILGYKPKISIKKGLEDLIHFYQKKI